MFPTSHGRSNEPDRPRISPRSEKQFYRLPSQDDLHFRRYPLVLLWVAIYAALTLFAWIVSCWSAVDPAMARRHFNADLGSVRANNESWLRAAQVIRTVVAVLTIPLTSTVCIKTAAAWVQRRDGNLPTLRQTATLADRGWTDPVIYAKLLTGGFRQYATKLLIASIALNLIGCTVAPLQSFFLSTGTVKTPTDAIPLPSLLTDLIDMAGGLDDPTATDANLIPVKLRSAMAAASNASPQSRLWTAQTNDCTQATLDSEDRASSRDCTLPYGTLGSLSVLSDQFLAQLPSGFSTGVIRQYLPRINSTASRFTISESDYPKKCKSLPDAFYAKFGAEDPIFMGFANFTLEACMPANMSQSPWLPVRERQDFSEELFLNVSLFSGARDATEEDKGGLFKIVVNTTAGYFELPNLMNNERSGPLLQDDPLKTCGEECASQSEIGRSAIHPRSEPDFVNEISASAMDLEVRPNRGPLLAIAQALFGSGSFIAERMSRPEAFLLPNVTAEERREDTDPERCVDQLPFANLLHSKDGEARGPDDLDPCVRNDVHTYDDLQAQVASLVGLLYQNSKDGSAGDRIADAFTAAAFLANELWLTEPSEKTWTVSYDPGSEAVVSVISKLGVVVVSVFLGLHLLAILCLTIYSLVTPRWTENLDSYAMLKIGLSTGSGGEDVELMLDHRAQRPGSPD